jgi:hypothetical protein
MAPRRPLLFLEQYALALATTIVIVASIAFALWALFWAG